MVILGENQDLGSTTRPLGDPRRSRGGQARFAGHRRHGIHHQDDPGRLIGARGGEARRSGPRRRRVARRLVPQAAGLVAVDASPTNGLDGGVALDRWPPSGQGPIDGDHRSVITGEGVVVAVQLRMAASRRREGTAVDGRMGKMDVGAGDADRDGELDAGKVNERTLVDGSCQPVSQDLGKGTARDRSELDGHARGGDGTDVVFGPHGMLDQLLRQLHHFGTELGRKGLTVPGDLDRHARDRVRGALAAVVGRSPLQFVQHVAPKRSR